MIAGCLFSAVLIVVFFIDLEHYIIPDIAGLDAVLPAALSAAPLAARFMAFCPAAGGVAAAPGAVPLGDGPPMGALVLVEARPSAGAVPLPLG